MIRRLIGLNNQNNQQSNQTPNQLPRPLAPGTPAPDFELPATTSESVRLSDFRGRPVVLAFYPADASPVCSNQLALYNECLHLFAEHDACLLAISTDDLGSHQAFAGSLNLRFPLLADSDPKGAVARAYNVLAEADGTSERALLVLDSDGYVRWSYLSQRGENPGADGILEALEKLRDSV